MMADDAARIAQLEAELRQRDESIAAAHTEIVALREENAALAVKSTAALEQQTATAEVLRVIASSPTNLETVLQAILNAAARLCDAEHGILFPRRERDDMLGMRAGHGLFREWLGQGRETDADDFGAHM
jgi:two-component system NtrC family sensor kinase